MTTAPLLPQDFHVFRVFRLRFLVLAMVCAVMPVIAQTSGTTRGTIDSVSYKSPAEFEQSAIEFTDDENLEILEREISVPGPAHFLTMPLLNLYRKYVSPAKGFHCPMYPSCSSYGKEAFSRHNPIKAFWMTSDRLTRCGHEHGHYPVVYVDGIPKLHDPVAKK
jgi:putative component of membrane protein insertase Oxa1/YidC/SpoIIIJ protein YidD